MPAPMHLAVALDATGFHPASWRDPSARPGELFEPQYWIDVARTAESGLVDFLTIEDSVGLQTAVRNRPDERVDQVRGRLQASLVASFMAARTSGIGLVPTAVPTHSEPFHLASAIATLDHVSRGRAGWRPQISTRADEAALVGRRDVPDLNLSDRDDPRVRRYVEDLFDEAADTVEVVRRLWDSWEDDALVADVAGGRFIGRDKVHPIDFEGRFFRVRGPSIVPRPPQGNPLVVALAHQRVPFEFAARSADLVLLTPADRDDVSRWIGAVRQAEAVVGRGGVPLKLFAELVVFLGQDDAAAAARKAVLDERDGRVFRSDAPVFLGTPDGLVDLLVAWQAEGLDGFRLRPAVIGYDLDAIVEQVVPRLQARGAFRTEYDSATLRERFGLGRPASRSAPARPAD